MKTKVLMRAGQGAINAMIAGLVVLAFITGIVFATECFQMSLMC